VSLCPHGYSAFWDCPLCECPGCGRPQDLCNCHLERAIEHRLVAAELERADRTGTLADEIAGGVAFVLLLAGGYIALHLQ